MSGGRWGRIVLVGVVLALVAALVRALRGPAAPQFGHHPSVTGGPAPTPRPEPAADDDEPPRALAAPEAPAGELAAPPHHEALASPPAVAGELDAPAAPAGELEEGGAPSWVAPVEGACPDGFPIKAKLKSGIYHQPGGLAYERTRPDRCYPDPAAAEADGLRAAKR